MDSTESKEEHKSEPLTAACWLRVHVPVEITPQNDKESVLGGLAHLLVYMRQKVQADRRFALGLLLCRTDFFV
ncbi:hypothetical protein SCP_0508500 [Sparassis crispa]|uniref:Uncharacterized protein n=1 Tax=Sparassis crispa TaxID=139825 RepID=A0A401GNK1_9APHY|nr:hypothetical protein SCP_0508500 [Sparassis crispa]GBE83793.1 hypothetical protein SCP_0508500 [Sparassis crispa]